MNISTKLKLISSVTLIIPLCLSNRIKNSDTKKEIHIECGDITINPLTHRVFIKDKEIELKNKEYELLLIFMNNIDIVFNKEQLYESVWGYDSLGEN